MAAPPRLQVLRSVVANFGNLSTDPAYIFGLCRSPDGAALAAPVSSNAVKLYSTERALTLVSELLGHTHRISSLKFPLPQQEVLLATAGEQEPYTLGSSSEDGTVRLWDMRTGQQTAQFSMAGRAQELNDFDVSQTVSGGHLVTAGGEGRVLFWDRRNGDAPVKSFEECHGDAVTQTMFVPGRTDVLLTASVDGLVCAFDVKHSLDDEEGLLQVMNIGSSVARIGTFGPEKDLLWCLTSTEELSLWDWEEYDPLVDLSNTRGRISSVCGVPTDQLYCIGCKAEPDPLAGNDPSAEMLWLMAGTKDGNAMAMRVSAYQQRKPQHYPYQQPQPSQQQQNGSTGTGIDVPAVLFPGAHTSTIRAIELNGTSFNELEHISRNAADVGGRTLCWTGGEDALVVEWGTGAEKGGAGGTHTGGESRVERRSAGAGSGRERHAPY